MKKPFKPGLRLVALAIAFFGCLSLRTSAQTVSASITYQTFYDNLSPYGDWIQYPGYGNVWNPRTDEDFRPYATNGNWTYSDEGWAWQSNYAWGWAAFHYGRWLYDDNYGWLWVPGYDWSPAWVTWGSVDDDYCWAPLMPDVNVIGDYGTWRPHSFYWNVCGRDHIYDHNLSTVIERPERVTTVVNRITIINNFNTTHRNKLHYSRGPDVTEVQRFTKEKINPISFKEVRKANQASHHGNVVNVYRPTVESPQPRQFRRAEGDQVRPIRNEEDKPSRQKEEQRKNVQNLPMHQMPGIHDNKPLQLNNRVPGVNRAPNNNNNKPPSTRKH